MTQKYEWQKLYPPSRTIKLHAGLPVQEAGLEQAVRAYLKAQFEEAGVDAATAEERITDELVADVIKVLKKNPDVTIQVMTDG